MTIYAASNSQQNLENFGINVLWRKIFEGSISYTKTDNDRAFMSSFMSPRKFCDENFVIEL